MNCDYKEKNKLLKTIAKLERENRLAALDIGRAIDRIAELEEALAQVMAESADIARAALSKKKEG